MDWSGADFFTIIGTNVYSRLFARALRKDHGQPHFAFMPARYATDALEHMILFRENYKFAYQQNSGVFNLFKGQSADWNPFSSFTPNLVPESFTVEVENRWWWDFDLYGDGNARWIDQKNVAEYGIGKWRMEGNDYLINWKGGASDRFPKFKNGGWGFVEGHGRLASGTAYDSSVTARAPGSA